MIEGKPLLQNPPLLEYHKGRVLAVTFVFKGTHAAKPKTITIVNGHFRYDNHAKERISIESTVSEITTILNTYSGQVLLAADINQPTEEIARHFHQQCFYAVGGTSLYHKTQPRRLIEQNIDIFLFKHAPIF